MKKITKAAVGTALALGTFVTSTSAFAAGPIYPKLTSPEQYVGRICQGNMAAAYDSSNGNMYARTSVNFGCASAYIEIIYIDNSGTERYARNTKVPGIGVSNYAQAVVNRNNYRKVLEVYGSIYSDNQSRVCTFFYNPSSVTCAAG